jgi:hypothetical protein
MTDSAISRLDEFKNVILHICQKLNDYQGFHGRHETKFRNSYGVSWIIGGNEGGSCYGTDLTPIESEDEPSFNVLQELRDKIAPGTQTYELLREGDSEPEGDYYGNYSIYRTKTFDLEMLYFFLEKIGKLNDLMNAVIFI